MAIRGKLVLDKVAQQWLERIESFKVSDEDRESFARWYEVPANQEAFEQAKNEAENLKAMLETISHRPAIESLRQRVLDETAHKVEAQAPERKSPANTFFHRLYEWRRWIMSGSFAMAVAVFVFAIFIPQQRNTYTTAVGEQRVVMLEDGSRVTMDTDTQMRVRFEESQRHIHLNKGQAYFEVAKNTARPFSVVSQHGLVTAVGTAFSVFESQKKLQVTLTEGKVQVATSAVSAADEKKAKEVKSIGNIVSLNPGEQLVFDTSVGVRKQKLEDLNHQMSWLTGKLMFKNAPLSEVVETLNRYFEKTIVVRDRELLATEVDAIFSTKDIDTSIQALRAMFNLDAFLDEAGNIELRANKS